MVICKPGEYREINYTDKRWEILDKLRNEAKNIMFIFTKHGYKPYVYGSVARGDVNENSDIDITFLYAVDPNLIEILISNYGYNIEARYIVMATPTYTPKAYIWLDIEGKRQVSIFLAKPKSRSVEFYKFGGLLDYNNLLKNKRVTGVDKRLMLIQPTRDGHIESCIIGREGEVAKLLNVSQEIVFERVRKLSKRDAVGRTGVYLEYRLGDDETFGEAIAKLRKTNKFFRKMLG